MEDNSSVFALQEAPHFLLLVSIWVPTCFTIIFSLVIINYLQSKPLHSKTVMDFVNKIFFMNFCFFSTNVGLSSTLIFFKDCGEIAAYLIAYISVFQLQNISILILCVIFTQLLLVRNPLNLESDSFECSVRAIAGYAAPSYSAIISVAFYFIGVKPRIYYVLRGKQDWDNTFALFQACIMLLVACVFMLSRLWIQKIQPDGSSNHILSSKAVGLLFMDGAVFFSVSILIFKPYFEYLFSIGSVVIISKFIASIVIFHESVRNHTFQFEPFRSLRVFWSVRLARKVSNNSPNPGPSLNNL